MQHRVSIGLPTYNRPDLLRAAVASLAAQTHENDMHQDTLRSLLLHDGMPVPGSDGANGSNSFTLQRKMRS